MNRDLTHTRSSCCYCGTGCGVIIHSAGGKIVGVEGDPDHPANFGKLCTKGNTLHLATVQTGRATVPMLRETRDVPRTPTTWANALDTAAERFAAIIREHGPDAVGFYISGQLLTEDYYVFNKLARALVGTNNIDSNSRLCMSSAVAAYKATLGSDAVPCSYEDIDLADLILIAGANPAFAHPIVYRRIEAARAANPDLKLIVVDPRRTDTAADADLHLAITPGSDVLLYSAMLHVLLWEGMVDDKFITEHTTGFADLRKQLAELTPGAVAAVCGIKADDIITAARWFGQAKAPLSFWCQGLNQSTHGTANGAALIHLHLATGTIGKPGMGPFSLTGQPNAMGGRETGAMANLLPGHRNLTDAADRADIAALWGIPAIPELPGKTAVEMFDAVRDGSIKAIWIACTNPAQSLPDLTRVREALQTAEFVVVQDAWADTETAAFADLLLPAATWGEKDGTVTNSERRITRVRAAVLPPGEARADWRIARDFALALSASLSESRHPGENRETENAPEADAHPSLPFQGGGQEGDGAEAGSPQPHPHPAPPLEGEGTMTAPGGGLFPFTTPAEVYAEHVATTVGRDLDIGALSPGAPKASAPPPLPLQGGETAAHPLLPLQGGGGEGDGVKAVEPSPHPHPAPPLEGEGTMTTPTRERLFPFTTPADVYAEHVATTLGRDLDIGALSHAALDRLGPQQWPFPKDAGAGTQRLYADHRFAHPDGKARFVALTTALTAETPDARHPFRLVTGRLRDQWHGMSRTGRIPRLYAHEPEPNVRLHPADLTRRGWTEGTLVKIKSRRGEIILPLAASEDVRPGQAFVAMHWGRHELSHDGVNALTVPFFDPVSKQPELKHAAVRIEPAELPWRLTLLRSPGEGPTAEEQVLAWRAALEPLLAEIGADGYAALTLDGRDRPLVALRVATAAPLSAGRIERIALAADLPEALSLDYQDRSRGILKRARIEGSRLNGILLAGEDAAVGWLRTALRDGVAIDELRRWIFAPRATPPVAAAAPRRVVCNCFDVSADAIEAEIKSGQTLPAIQEKLKCGTSCGSCLTEVRRMVGAVKG